MYQEGLSVILPVDQRIHLVNTFSGAGMDAVRIERAIYPPTGEEGTLFRFRSPESVAVFRGQVACAASRLPKDLQPVSYSAIIPLV